MFTKLLLCLHKIIIYYICMNIDKTLNIIIKILVSMIICIMLTIGFLFVTPVSVHADDSVNYLEQYKRDINDFRLTYSYPTLTFLSSSASAYGMFSLTEPFSVSSGDVLTLYCNEVYPNIDCSISVYSGNSYLTSFKLDSVRSVDYTFTSSYSNITIRIQNYAYSVPEYPYSFDLTEYFSVVPSSSSGAFISLPQDSYTSTFDFDTIKTFGAWIYSGYNVYSLYGSYNTVVSPTSQYCYIDNGDDTYSCAVFSSVPLTVYSAFVNGDTYTYYVCSQYDVGKYYYLFNQDVDISGLSVQSFASLEAAQSAFSGASSGVGGGSASGVVSAGAMTLNVPAGNVLYVRPRAGSLAKLTVVMPYKSSPYSPYWDRTQSNVYWLSGVSSLPDSNTSFPLSGMSNINWSLDESSVDGYGRGYNGYTNHAPFNAGWFVVYNPLYTLPISKGNDNSLSINPTVTVSMQYATEYYIYDLNERITSSGGNSSSLTDYDTSEHGVYDPGTDTTNTSSTLPNGEPVIGGQQVDTISTDLTFNDYFHIFTETLSEFANSVVNIFTAPISHIGQLISSGSTFMSTIGQFFTWLPAPVYQILVDALVVAVAVGVFKLLL